MGFAVIGYLRSKANYLLHKRRRWEAHILQTVTNRPGKKSEYILLRSGQLVGTALIVLIKASLADDVRNVEVATKKVFSPSVFFSFHLRPKHLTQN